MSVKNVCDCPTPPGGQTVCEPDQAAFCRVLNGRVEAGCANPPDVSSFAPGQRNTVRDNWALVLITRTRRNPDDPIDQKDAGMLASGQYRNPKTGEEVHFRLPWMTGRGGSSMGGSGGDPVSPVLGLGPGGAFEFESEELAEFVELVDQSRELLERT